MTTKFIELFNEIIATLYIYEFKFVTNVAKCTPLGDVTPFFQGLYAPSRRALKGALQPATPKGVPEKSPQKTGQHLPCTRPEG